jgi:cytochrome P450
MDNNNNTGDDDLWKKMFNPTSTTAPFKLYRDLRKNYRIHQFKPSGMWTIIRYEDVRYALQNSKVFSSADVSTALIPEWLRETSYAREYALLFDDNPLHSIYRGLLSDSLSRPAMTALTNDITRDAETLVDLIGVNKRLDALIEIAYPFATSCIYRLLEIDEDNRCEHLAVWAALMEQHPLQRDQRYLVMLAKYTEEVSAYINNLIKVRRENPGSDLISQMLIQSRSSQEITEETIRQLVELLFRAGIQPVAQSIGYALFRISTTNDLFREIKQQPDNIEAFIHEVFRSDPIEHVVARKTTTNACIGNMEIPKNATAILFIASANHDPDQFDQPDIFDISRKNNKSHLSFGAGLHRCVGEALSKLEIGVLIAAITRRFSSVEIQQGGMQQIYRFSNYTVETMPIKFN